MNVTLRWASALPIQQALLRQGGMSADESKTIAEAAPKDYVIELLGFRMPSGRRRSSDVDSSDSSGDDRSRPDQKDDALRSRLIDAAQLIPKGKSPIYAEDVQFEGPNGATEIRFLFPKTKAISADDKEVVFRMETQGTKLEHKFRLSDMTYQGKLAL